VANHNLLIMFGSKNAKHHSIFGRNKVIDVPVSPNLVGTRFLVPNGLFNCYLCT